MSKFIRHGDLLIQSVDAIPEGLKLKEDTVLLEGEATNHFHRLHSGTVLLSTETPRKENNYHIGYFKLDETTELTHEEHHTITLKKGYYKFYSQREYDELSERRVID